MRNKFIAIFIGLVLVGLAACNNNLSAQNTNEKASSAYQLPGYIVTNNKDTVRGTLRKAPSETYYRRIDFMDGKTGELRKKLEPIDIMGFGYTENDKAYRFDVLDITLKRNDDPVPFFVEFVAGFKQVRIYKVAVLETNSAPALTNLLKKGNGTLFLVRRPNTYVSYIGPENLAQQLIDVLGPCEAAAIKLEKPVFKTDYIREVVALYRQHCLK